MRIKYESSSKKIIAGDILEKFKKDYCWNGWWHWTRNQIYTSWNLSFSRYAHCTDKPTDYYPPHAPTTMLDVRNLKTHISRGNLISRIWRGPRYLLFAKTVTSIIGTNDSISDSFAIYVEFLKFCVSSLLQTWYERWSEHLKSRKVNRTLKSNYNLN